MPKRHDNEKKKRKDAYPKKVCHMSTRHVKKRRRRRRRKYIYIYSPCPRKKYTKREIDHPIEFTYYPPKIFHTLAPLDQIV